MRKLLKVVFILIFTTGLSSSMYSQTAVCGFDRILQEKLKDPAIAQKVKETNKAIAIKANQIKEARTLNKNAAILGNGLYEIPVIVHVIYRPTDAVGTTYNPSDANIQAMVDHLNYVYTGGNSYNQGASLPFRFALAKRSPSCGATTGIERIDGSSLAGYTTDGVSLPGSGATGANENDIKKLSIWPVNSYYNLWIVWKINAVGLADGTYIAGYADLPYSIGISGSDGAVLNAKIVNGTSSVLPHEMGHAMGLLHTFEDGDADNCPPAETPANCATSGDLVCDTDPVKNLLLAGTLADNAINPCTNTAFNGSQRNIMGYGSGLNKFTQGQSDRSMATFQVARSGFITSVGSQTPSGEVAKASTPPPNIANPTNRYNMGPCNITFNTLLSSTIGYDEVVQNYYVDNSCSMGTKLQADNIYPFTVTTQTNKQTCKAWIDFNNDGTFDNATELIMNSNATTPEFTHTTTIYPSVMYGSNVVYGKILRMRIAADFVTNTTFTATSQLGYGQSEDYFVQIDPPVPAVFNSLTASIKSNTLNINWTTSTEKNNDHFVVQISSDGNTFKDLATVTSTATSGESSATISYALTKNAKEVNSILGGLLLALFVLSIIFYRRNKWMVSLGIILLIAYLPINACRKKDPGINASQVFVKVKTVSKSGYTLYSNTVQATKQ